MIRSGFVNQTQLSRSSSGMFTYKSFQKKFRDIPNYTAALIQYYKLLAFQKQPSADVLQNGYS